MAQKLLPVHYVYTEWIDSVTMEGDRLSEVRDIKTDVRVCSNWVSGHWGGSFVMTTDQSHKSHNALDKYPTMHHFVTEMCTHVHISVTKWCIVVYGTGALLDMGLVHCGIVNLLLFLRKFHFFFVCVCVNHCAGIPIKSHATCFCQQLKSQNWVCDLLYVDLFHELSLKKVGLFSFSVRSVNLQLNQISQSVLMQQNYFYL